MTHYYLSQITNKPHHFDGVLFYEWQNSGSLFFGVCSYYATHIILIRIVL
jgi:hypothetical protein